MSANKVVRARVSEDVHEAADAEDLFAQLGI